MDRPTLMAIVIAFLILLLVLMYLGWRARQRRQASLPRPHRVPAEPGRSTFSSEVFYVATTMSGEPLNRVAVSGLGYRAKATVSVTDGGMILAIPGQDDLFIPRGDLRGVERSTWTIDRVVEEGGLVLVAWTLTAAEAASVDVDSYFRLDSAESAALFITEIHRLLTTSSTRGDAG